MTMSKATAPFIKSAFLALCVLVALVVVAGTAGAATVHLRIEGAGVTQFNGDVNTEARSVPGGVDQPVCRANGTAASFGAPTALTAVADALGDANVATSGTFYGWGTLLCGVNGEFPADTNGGWLIRINQQDSTAPNGYVTATDPLSNGDRVLLFLSPSYGFYSSSLELKLPAETKPGVPVTGFVDSYSTSDDSKSPAASAAVSGGGASASSASDGSFSISFPTEGKYLVTATKSGAIRGSQWVTVDAGAEPTPVKPTTQKEINKQRRIAARANCRSSKGAKGFDYKVCIRQANSLGRTKTAKQKRIEARAKCVANYPAKGSASRKHCVRAANRIGR